MPDVAVPVLERLAVSRARDVARRLVGKGIRPLAAERTERCRTDERRVGIARELRAGRGVLEVIAVPAAEHVRALDVGIAVRLLVAVAPDLPAVAVHVDVETRQDLRLRGERPRIELAAEDRIPPPIPAPVEVKAAVVVRKERRVDRIRNLARQFLPPSRGKIDLPVNRPPAGGVMEIAADCGDRRRPLLGRHLRLLDPTPRDKIRRHEIAAALRGEQPVGACVPDDLRIGRRRKVRIRRPVPQHAVAHVQRIGERLPTLLRRPAARRPQTKDDAHRASSRSRLLDDHFPSLTIA